MVWVNKNITQDFIEKMRKGVRIMGKMTKRCYVKRINDNRFKIVLIQGMNRQIRRMCEVLGYRVTKLKRIRIMNIHLDINVGEYRNLNEEEVKKLFNQ
jgi:23S rRNA pseudouridine2604 synthase